MPVYRRDWQFASSLVGLLAINLIVVSYEISKRKNQKENEIHYKEITGPAVNVPQCIRVEESALDVMYNISLR